MSISPSPSIYCRLFQIRSAGGAVVQVAVWVFVNIFKMLNPELLQMLHLLIISGYFS